MINLPFSVGAMLDRERDQLNYEIRRELFEKVALDSAQYGYEAMTRKAWLEYCEDVTNAILKAADEFAREGE